jgi:hypothetical protein
MSDRSEKLLVQDIIYPLTSDNSLPDSLFDTQ